MKIWKPVEAFKVVFKGRDQRISISAGRLGAVPSVSDKVKEAAEAIEIVKAGLREPAKVRRARRAAEIKKNNGCKPKTPMYFAPARKH